MSPPYVARQGGHELFVRDWREGRPVMLTAGCAMDGRIWGETMLRLNTAGLRTVAYDRRGHGRYTDWGEYDYDALADDLAAVLISLDLADVALVAQAARRSVTSPATARRGGRDWC